MTKIAFVLPFFDEEEVIEQFHAVLAKTVQTRPDLDFEFIYVNDGSSDSSPQRVLALREHDPRITLLSFSKNYGHEVASTAGLDLAHSIDVDAVVLMDTDLQDPPATALAMIERWEAGTHVVYAQRRSRQDGMLKKVSADMFYWVLTHISETRIPPRTSNFRVMDRRALAAVVAYRESDRFLRGIVSHVGFTQEPFLFDRDERAAGKTHYTLRHMLSLAKSGIFGFSTWPLRIITRIGVGLALLAVMYGLFALGEKIFFPTIVVPGWTAIVVAMMFLGGLQMMILGVMGHYIGRIYAEILHRPLYVIESLARTGNDEFGQ